MDDAEIAADLRLQVGRLVRRGRAEDPRPQPVTAALGLLDREGPLTTSELAAAQRVRPQSMARTVRTLEEDGLVERSTDPTDARKSPVVLTARGREALAQERRRRTDWLTLALADALDPAERETLAAAVPLMARIVAWDERRMR
ncbi:MarR family winged helix-turn-helix transcriptional regulator [Cellulomonas sp. CW35]|uniref:MarR family winged helix-turn-helix transcriptional regulator n=1 Tax=Cellulomonas sp. CW35 TaxID=3458249 RepID=UPI000A5A7F49